MASGFYKGTNLSQDSRFGDQNKKLMKRMNFAPILNSKVDISKVNMLVIKKWITEKVTELLGGFEDEILIDMVVNTLQNPSEGSLDPKELQIHLTAFFHKNTAAFMEELWTLLVDAQNNIGGIPSVFLERKKLELQQRDNATRNQRQEISSKLYDSRFVKSKRDTNTEKTIEGNEQPRDSTTRTTNRANPNSNGKQDDNQINNRRRSLNANQNDETYKKDDSRVNDVGTTTNDAHHLHSSSPSPSRAMHFRIKSKNRHRSRSRSRSYSRSRSRSRSRSIPKRGTNSSKKSKSKTKKHRSNTRSRSPSKSESDHSEKRR